MEITKMKEADIREYDISRIVRAKNIEMQKEWLTWLSICS